MSYITEKPRKMEHNTETIWNACRKPLRAFIMKRVSDQSVIDDLLQDVFIKIHLNIDYLKDDTKIESWIFQIARNTIIDYYRKRKNDHDDIDMIEPSTLISESEELNYTKDIAEGLLEMTNALPEKYGEAIRLVEFQGMPQTELAKELGISVSGAKSRVQRGRQMLKDDLMRCCHFQFDKYGNVVDAHPKKCCCCNQWHEEQKIKVIQNHADNCRGC